MPVRSRQFLKAKAADRYIDVKDKYLNLGINLTQALEMFLKENDINTLAVSYRVKDKESFIEKIDRKKYNDPFEDIEDLCGIRILCYYQSDVRRISDLINKEFEVLENQDKEDLLNDDQFGYRSTHFIVKIKKDWLQAPNYRGLENLKAEIQVRTVLMHAWADIAHKLSYKKETDVPKQFKRRLSMISAMLEVTDGQFEDLRDSIVKYRQEVVEITTRGIDRESKVELNFDSLQAFLDSAMPTRYTDTRSISKLVDELLTCNITLNEVIAAYEKVKPVIPKLEKDAFGDRYVGGGNWTQGGVIRVVMAIMNDQFFENRNHIIQRLGGDTKWREELKEALSK